MTHIIGVDAGGTKTLFALYTQTGIEMDTLSIPTCHYMQVGYDKMRDMVKDAVESLLQQNHIQRDNVYVCFGMAGYGRIREVRENIETAIKEALDDIPFSLYSDVEAGMVGVLGAEDGIAVISGTGSIAFSLRNGTKARCGGWGYSIGDEGSAYWIARQMLAAFSRQADGREKKTALYDILKRELSFEDDYDVIVYVNETLQNKRDQIAKLAKYVFEAAQMNDKVALGIYKDAAKELAALINTLAKDFKDETVTTSYIGGVFKAKDFILEPLGNYVDKNVRIVAPVYGPEYGAYILATRELSK